MQTARARATATDNRMLTAMSKERSHHRRSGLGGNVHGTARTSGYLLVAAVVALLGTFVATSGAGSGNAFVGAIGLGMAISAGVYVVFTLVRRRLASMVPGTAHVVSVSTRPVGATHGRAEMHLVVQAPRLSATAVSHRDASVPVAKWPSPGVTVPVVVDPRNPRDVRIRWNQVRPQGGADKQADKEPETTRSRPTTGADDLARIAEATGVSANGAAADRASANGSPAGLTTVDNKPATGDPGTATTAATTQALALPATDNPVTSTAPGTDEPASYRSSDDQSIAGSSLSSFFDASNDEPIDLSFLDPPKLDSLVENDPLLIEYGSPIREVGVTLIVSDLKESLEFYRDVLGFFEIENGPDMILLEARTGRLVLRQREDARPKPPRLMHLTLEVNDITTAYNTLSKRGVEFLDEPRTVLTGETLELWAVSFHDPDGHGVALTSWQARTESEPTAQDPS